MTHRAGRRHHPTRACAVCTRRLPETPAVCEHCRARLARQLASLPELIELYAETLTARDPLTEPGRANDPISAMLPAGPVSATVYGTRTTGGAVEPSMPIDLGLVDVAARPPLYILGTWVRTWIDTTREAMPAGLAAEIAWLATHLDAACDRGSDIADFATDLTDLTTQLRRVAHSRYQLIGYCPVEDCGNELRADPTAKATQCLDCGTIWPRRHWLWLTDTLRAA